MTAHVEAALDYPKPIPLPLPVRRHVQARQHVMAVLEVFDLLRQGFTFKTRTAQAVVLLVDVSPVQDVSKFQRPRAPASAEAPRPTF